MPQLISATQARDSFSEILNRVIYAGEDFIVKRRSKPVVLITKLQTPEERKYLEGTEFLNQLSKYKAKNLPRDLATNHDQYAWG